MLKSAKNTEKVIVKEYHDGNSYGMNAKEVEDLVRRNTALEQEVKRSMVNNPSMFKDGSSKSITRRYVSSTDNVPVR